MLDDTDRHLLRRWQAAPDMPLVDLAAACGLTVGKATRRIDRLREAGILIGHHAVINWPALGYEVQVSLRVTLDKTNSRAFDEFINAARQIAEVIEIQTFLGRVDVRLSVVARTLAHYQDIYRSQILPLPHIADIESLMTIASIKSNETLPL